MAIDRSGLTPALVAGIDAIFLEASGRAFAAPAELEAFRERWLGRYLEGGTDVVLVALDRAGAVVGYLVGALDDPAEQQRFADMTYLRRAFRDLCRRYPAHLHVNLAPAFRGRGIGARLVATFAARAGVGGAPGMHVVTAGGARNVRFYLRCGFAALGAARWHGQEVVFLAKALAGEHNRCPRS